MEQQWQPDLSQLEQIVSFLIALRDPTRSDHITAVNALTGYCENSDFILNIVHLFVKGSIYESLGLFQDVRQMAGYVIKNYIIPKLSLCLVTVQQFVKYSILEALADPVIEIQHTAANVFGNMIKTLSIDRCLDIIPPLIERLDPSSGHPSLLAGSLRALKIINEDAGESLCQVGGGQIFDSLIPRLVSILMQCHDYAPLVADALHCCCALLEVLPAVDPDDVASYQSGNVTLDGCNDSLYLALLKLTTFLSPLLTAVSGLAQHVDSSVRNAVYRTLQLLTLTMEGVPAFSQMLPSIRIFMAGALMDPDDSAAIQACDFWFVLIENSRTVSSVTVHLPQIIPALIARMRLSDEQRLQEQADAEAMASGEKQLPFVFNKNSDNDEGEEGDDSSFGTWTIRKQAGCLLDTISEQFVESEILPFALPAIEQRLNSADVWDQEAAMLALGALCNGCLRGLGEQVLPLVVAMCIKGVQHEVPEMRCMSCWFLSRCCPWFFDDNNAIGIDLFQQSLAAIASSLLDPSPQVQGSACISLTHFVEFAGDEMIPYLQPIMSGLPQCFVNYGIRNNVLAWDFVSTVATSVGDALDDTTLTPCYLPYLISRLRIAEDDNSIMIPLLECLAEVCVAIRMQMTPYAAELASRSLRIVYNSIEANSAAESSVVSSDSAHNKDFAGCGLYLLTGLSEGLGSLFAELMSGHIDSFIPALLTFAVDVDPNLRLHALALCGEICRSSPAIFATSEVRQHIVRLVLPQMTLSDDESVPTGICSNAIWLVGNFATSYGGTSDLEPYLGHILSALEQLLMADETPISIRQNIAVTMGTLGHLYGSVVSNNIITTIVRLFKC